MHLLCNDCIIGSIGRKVANAPWGRRPTSPRKGRPSSHRSAVTVMEIRQVRMLVLEGRVFVAVGVWLTRGIIGEVRVPMMLIVHVTMVVLHRFVSVRMRVVFTQQQVDAEHHQQHGAEFP